MYNTLKEIQNSLSEKELYMYADKAEGKTPEEIVEMLKLDNIDISIEAAKECVDYLKKEDVLSDEELENVTGGGCGSDPEPKYKVNQRVSRYFSASKNYRYYTIIEVCEYNSDHDSYRYKLKADGGNSTQDHCYLDTDDSFTLVS